MVRHWMVIEWPPSNQAVILPIQRLVSSIIPVNCKSQIWPMLWICNLNIKIQLHYNGRPFNRIPCTRPIHTCWMRIQCADEVRFVWKLKKPETMTSSHHFNRIMMKTCNTSAINKRMEVKEKRTTSTHKKETKLLVEITKLYLYFCLNSNYISKSFRGINKKWMKHLNAFKQWI